MIIAPKTQIYSDSQDPPRWEGVMKCVEGNFNTKMEHCWSWTYNDIFEPLFVEPANTAAGYMKDPVGYMALLKKD